jgi:hypothetical protein
MYTAELIIKRCSGVDQGAEDEALRDHKMPLARNLITPMAAPLAGSQSRDLATIN